MKNYHRHIDEIYCKAIKKLGYLCVYVERNEFKFSAKIKSFYSALIKSLSEGNVMWNTCDYVICYFYKIERVQRKFLNFANLILGIDHSPCGYS